MSARFNVDTFFEIAVQMEENGEKFYRNAAKLFKSPTAKRLLESLADAEVAHAKAFTELRERAAGWTELGGTPPVGALTLVAMAESKIFGPDDDPSTALKGDETPMEILRTAIEKEKDSVLFYQALQDAVTDPEGKDRIVEILMEEIKHVTSLRSEVATIVKILGKDGTFLDGAS